MRYIPVYTTQRDVPILMLPDFDAPDLPMCPCGRILERDAVYCDACGKPVPMTGATTRLDGRAR